MTLAKKGAKLPTVSYTVIGTRTAPMEKDVRPINPTIHLIIKGALNSFSIAKP